jgi:hypothetical protein
VPRNLKVQKALKRIKKINETNERIFQIFDFMDLVLAYLRDIRIFFGYTNRRTNKMEERYTILPPVPVPSMTIAHFNSDEEEEEIEIKETDRGSDSDSAISPSLLEPLEVVKEKYEFVEATTLDNFADIKDLVLDSEGHIREREAVMAQMSLYTHQPIAIIESADLKKVQRDVKSLEKKYKYKMVDIFSELKQMREEITSLKEENKIMRHELKEQDKKIEAQDKHIKKQGKKIRRLKAQTKVQSEEIVNLKATVFEQNEEIVNLKSTVFEQKTEIDCLYGEVKKKDGIIDELSKQNLVLAKKDGIIDELSQQNKELVSQNKVLIKVVTDLMQEVKRLGGNVGLSIERNNALINQNQELKDRIAVLYPHNPSNIDSAAAVGQKWNGLTGFRDTLSCMTPNSVLTRKKVENALRKDAYDGNVTKLQTRLERDNTIVNGRGMPDALCSIARGFQDKTALMLASQKGHIECMQLLIASDADINALDRDNFTALDYAQQNKHKAAVDLLTNNSAINGVYMTDNLNKLGIQKEDGMHYENETFHTVINSQAVAVDESIPAALRPVR